MLSGVEFTIPAGLRPLIARYYFVRSSTHVVSADGYAEIGDWEARTIAHHFTSRMRAKEALVAMCGDDVGSDVRIVKVDVLSK